MWYTKEKTIKSLQSNKFNVKYLVIVLHFIAVAKPKLPNSVRNYILSAENFFPQIPKIYKRVISLGLTLCLGQCHTMR